VQNRLVSFANPHGDLTNSDLEQAGVLAQADVATEQCDLRELTLATLCNTTAAVSQNRKGSITVKGPPANMCQNTSLHRRHYRYCHEVSHISGDSNSMADDASRLWHLSDSQLLAHFNSKYPQTQLWQMRPLSRDAFGIDLYAGVEALRHSVVPKTQTDRCSTWEVWISFTEELGLEPFLSDYDGDPLDCFIVFAMPW